LTLGTLGIRAKLALISVGLILASTIAARIYLVSALDDLLTRRIRDDLAVRLALIERQVAGAGLPAGDRAAWDRLADDLGRRARARLTLIERGGAVLGDSELDGPDLLRMESHADREEVRAALARGHGESMRYSTTLGQRMLYLAVPIRHGGGAGVARLAVPLTEVDRATGQLRWIITLASLLALAVAGIMASVAAHFASRGVRALTQAARRMAKGDLAVRTGWRGGDEIAQLGQALDRLARSLSATLGELAGERDLLSGILKSLQEGVLVLDGEGRVLLLNPALRQILGLEEDVAGKLPLEAIRNAELQELIDKARASGTTASGEIEISGPRPRRLLVQAAPITGAPGRLLAVFADVTDMRRLETVRRDFVANVSHELRTPVASVRLAAETLQGDAVHDPALVRQFVDIIDRNAERLQRLVEDLLEISRIESRGLQLDPEPLVVAQVVEHGLSLFRERAERGQIRTGSRVVPGLPPVLADRRALEQVLCNLIDNAIKYSPAGAAVSVGAEVEGRHLRVAVRDTGPGIAAQHLPRLFERFYRVDPGRSRDLGGTGLGLSIVKHLVEAMGGSVRVESQVGAGSCFSFTLPLAS
jgi:two-component system phosphate regulon sensor histidine kinase PhoR